MESKTKQPVGKPGEIIAESGRRLAMAASVWLDDWYVSHSPRNGNYNAEGTWTEWVDLAKQIIELDKNRKA